MTLEQKRQEAETKKQKSQEAEKTLGQLTTIWHNAALVGQKFGCKEKVKDLENVQNHKSHVYGRSVSTVQKGPGK